MRTKRKNRKQKCNKIKRRKNKQQMGIKGPNKMKKGQKKYE
jgi:hypothetical protein